MLIKQTLEQIETELKLHFELLKSSDFGEPYSVELGNIATLDTDDGGQLKGKVVMSLVNIEEEKVLKNGMAYSEKNGVLKRHNPLIYLNLYVLFSATQSSAGSNAYKNALECISHIVTFFQGKYVFDHQNTPGLPNEIEKLIFDIHTLNFEYLNHLWGVLGGKYYPSILYKVRMVPIFAKKSELESVITTIGNSEESL